MTDYNLQDLKQRERQKLEDTWNYIESATLSQKSRELLHSKLEEQEKEFDKKWANY